MEEVSVPHFGAGSVSLSSGKVDKVAGAFVLAVQRRGGDHFKVDPPRDTQLESGMSLIVMADAEGRAKIEQKLKQFV